MNFTLYLINHCISDNLLEFEFILLIKLLIMYNAIMLTEYKYLNKIYITINYRKNNSYVFSVNEILKLYKKNYSQIK